MNWLIELMQILNTAKTEINDWENGNGCEFHMPKLTAEKR